MKSIDKLNKVNSVYSAILQVAREERPSGSWPVWMDSITKHFNDLARTYMSQAKEEMGILRAEQAVR